MRQFQDSPAGGAREPSSYFLVNDALDLHGLHDVGDELRVDVGVSDLLVEQSSDGALHTHTSVGLKTFNLGIAGRKFLNAKTVPLTLNFGLMVCGLKLTLRMGISPETEGTSACVRQHPPNSLSVCVCVMNSHLLRQV